MVVYRLLRKFSGSILQSGSLFGTLPVATERTVYVGAHAYHVDRLDSPLVVEPTRCRVGHPRIRLGKASYGRRAGQNNGGSGSEAERSPW
jgi:hypothetical protein